MTARKYNIIQRGPNKGRIRAIGDIPSKAIRRGDVGGFVDGYHNLSQEGLCWVVDDARITGNAHVKDDAWIWGNAEVSGNAVILGQTMLGGTSKVSGFAVVMNGYHRDLVVSSSEVIVQTEEEGLALWESTM
jgi:hypothetical protein